MTRRALAIALLGLLLFPTTSIAEAPTGNASKVLSNTYAPGFRNVAPLDFESI